MTLIKILYMEQFGDRQKICEKIKGYGIFSPEVWTQELNWIIGFSAVVDLCVAYSVFFSKKLNVHPAGLIGLQALVNGFYCYLGLSSSLICKNGEASTLFAATVYFSRSQESRDLALLTLAYSYATLMNFSFLITTCLDTVIVIDLYFTLRNSF